MVYVNEQQQLLIQMADIVTHNTVTKRHSIGRPLKDDNKAKLYFLLADALQYPHWLTSCQIDNILSHISSDCKLC